MIYRKTASGKKRINRPALAELLEGLKPGDTVAAAEMTRINRTTVYRIPLNEESKGQE